MMLGGTIERAVKGGHDTKVFITHAKTERSGNPSAEH
jgi:hypothetical protein